LTPPHILAMDKAVIDTIRGKDGVRRLMLNLAPRHGKSEYVSKYLASWFPGAFPDKRVILTSYEAGFAATWGRKARNLLEDHGGLFGVRIAASPSAADQWEIQGHSGGMVTAGIGGAITGRGADLAIIDDPHKNHEEANSQIARDRVWEWYQSTLYTRLEPNAAVVVIQTRWNEDDLSGRLIKEAKSPGGEKWRILKLPAINAEGKALWPERFPLEELLKIKRAIGDYHFEALYQQNPTPRDGSMFKVDRLRFIDAAPVGIRYVRSWDLAATENDGDFTAGIKMGKDSEGRIFVADVRRGQWATDERDRWLRTTAELDTRNCRIRLAEDPGQAGKSQTVVLSRLLNGFVFVAIRVTGDKITRADPFSSQVNAGNVFLVRGDWNNAYVDELRQFSKGKHDDQVDASADAFDELNNSTDQFFIGGLQDDDDDDEPQDNRKYGSMVEVIGPEKPDDLPPKQSEPSKPFEFYVGGMG